MNREMPQFLRELLDELKGQLKKTEECDCENCKRGRADAKYSLSEDTQYKLWQAGYKKEEKTLTAHENYAISGIDLINTNDGYLRIYYHCGSEHSNTDNQIAYKRMAIKDLTFEVIVAMIEKLKTL